MLVRHLAGQRRTSELSAGVELRPRGMASPKIRRDMPTSLAAGLPRASPSAHPLASGPEALRPQARTKLSVLSLEAESDSLSIQRLAAAPFDDKRVAVSLPMPALISPKLAAPSRTLALHTTSPLGVQVPVGSSAVPRRRSLPIPPVAAATGLTASLNLAQAPTQALTQAPTQAPAQAPGQGPVSAVTAPVSIPAPRVQQQPPPPPALSELVTRLARGAEVSVQGDGRVMIARPAPSSARSEKDETPDEAPGGSRVRCMAWSERHVLAVFDQAPPVSETDALPAPLVPLVSLVWRAARSEYGLNQLALRQAWSLTLSAAAHSDVSPVCALFTRLLMRSPETAAPAGDDVLWFWLMGRTALGIGGSIGRGEFGQIIHAASALRATARVFPALDDDEVAVCVEFAHGLGAAPRAAVAAAAGRRVTLPQPAAAAAASAVAEGAPVDAGCLLLSWLRIYEVHRSACIAEFIAEFATHAPAPGAGLTPAAAATALATVAKTVASPWAGSAANTIIQREFAGTSSIQAPDLAEVAARYDLVRRTTLPHLSHSRPSAEVKTDVLLSSGAF